MLSPNPPFVVLFGVGAPGAALGSQGSIYFDTGASTLYVKNAGVWTAAGSSFSGARVTKAANQVGANYSAGAIMSFDSETYDIGGWHDNAVNNSRLTTPAGITRVNFVYAVYNTLGTAGQFRSMRLFKNGAAFVQIPTNIGGNAEMGINGASGWLSTVAGDFWELWYFSGGDVSIDIIAADTFFSVEGR